MENVRYNRENSIEIKKPERNCGNCRYISEIDRDEFCKSLGNTYSSVYECRRNAPALKGWPLVKPSEYCGDHKYKKEIFENR